MCILVKFKSDVIYINEFNKISYGTLLCGTPVTIITLSGKYSFSQLDTLCLILVYCCRFNK